MKKLFAVSGILCAFVFAVEAQDQKVQPESAANSDTRITLDVNRVNMLFTVSDKKGRFVTDMKKGRLRDPGRKEATTDRGVRFRKRTYLCVWLF